MVNLIDSRVLSRITPLQPYRNSYLKNVKISMQPSLILCSSSHSSQDRPRMDLLLRRSSLQRQLPGSGFETAGCNEHFCGARSTERGHVSGKISCFLLQAVQLLPKCTGAPHVSGLEMAWLHKARKYFWNFRWQLLNCWFCTLQPS